MTVVSYPIYDASAKTVVWANDTEFNTGVFTNTHVVGTDDEANIQLLPISTTTFYADFNTLDATFAVGSITATPTGGASVSEGELLLNNDDLRYVDYSATSNIGVQTGSVRVKFIPNYSGTPATSQHIFNNVELLANNNNRIQLSHVSFSGIDILYYDSAGVLIAGTNAPFVAVANQEYEIEINWDLDTGFHNLIVDGIELFNNAIIGTRTNTSTLFRIGTTATPVAVQTSNFKLGSLQIFDAVQHSAGYTLPSQTYITDGTFESNVYDSGFLALDWNMVNINKVNSLTGAANISVRASDSPIPVGPYTPAFGSLEDEEILNVKGQYLQWFITFSDSGVNTSQLNNIGFYFNIPQTEVVSGG